MIWVDTHCHLNMLTDAEKSGEIDEIILRAKAKDVHYFLNVCVKLADFPALLRTAETYSFVSASVGSHPNEGDDTVEVSTLIALGQHQKVIAVGETGLDYYRDHQEKKVQQAHFSAHIQAAIALKKPLIIHTRAAKEDTLAIMRDEKADQIGGVMHCFTEDWEMAKKALEMNFYISLSGIVTFKNAEAIQLLAKKIPLDRLLIETDSPYLAPNPMRGKQNEPAYLPYTGEFIAALRGISVAELAEQTTQNYFNLFKGAEKLHV